MSVSEFVGAWRLVRYEFRRADGGLKRPMGDNPVGLLIYDSLGHMSGQLMRRDRPAFRAGSLAGGTDEEIRAAMESYVAYFGTYQVDPRRAIVTHHVLGSWFPNFNGTDQVRHYRFEGRDRLFLETPPRAGGTERRTGLLLWERVSA